MKNEITYFNRLIDRELVKWKNEDSHKPIILRGARQIGKSAAVRNLAKHFDYFLEINFEEAKTARDAFENSDLTPQLLCEKLSAIYEIPIIEGKTLLFFDEIQSCIPAISSLRFFYEKMPRLHVIAAGSLLEFALEEIPSFGVGRIRSMFMYPFSFAEFLEANGNMFLLEAIQKANSQNPLDSVLHEKTVYLLKLFMLIGGMPEVVATYVKKKNLLACQHTLSELTETLKTDFAKYKARTPALQIAAAFDSVIKQMGGKFKYSNNNAEYSIYQMKQAVELLLMAGLVIPVTHTSANGIPLGAEINPKFRKLMLIDTGIFQRLLGLQLSDVLLSNDFDAINKGGIAEMFVGLELLKSSSFYEQTHLYYWQREEKNARAEIDFVVQKNMDIVPIEVKSGKSGKMQSMHLFMKEKKSKMGIRTSLENFTEYGAITVVPLYAIGNVNF
ncbi:MAG: AAA family ATPase [Bacteroidales bacterium]|jgi:predicted AAA+ superfamily ATPase|nr:AAA family ATPase [Bacteroidales bacterium]